MADKFKETATVLSQEEIGSKIYSLWLSTEHIPALSRPGQFISVFSETADACSQDPSVSAR